MTDNSVDVIIALLPLTALMLVAQTNPYHALVIRGILGAVSALVYAVLGAADVALTEALVGTLLSVALYVVAVRSSLVMRLGIPEESLAAAHNTPCLKEVTTDVEAVLGKRHVRLELVPYPDSQALHQAFLAKEVHATCLPQAEDSGYTPIAAADHQPTYHITTRVKRLYDILQAERVSTAASLTYARPTEASMTDLAAQDLGRVAP
jgi:putative multicomponent Na+:H+ antiporter subunit B